MTAPSERSFNIPIKLHLHSFYFLFVQFYRTEILSAVLRACVYVINCQMMKNLKGGYFFEQ